MVFSDGLSNIQALNRKTFEQIKGKEFKPEYSLMGLKYLREKAGKERDLRELYRGRGPYELLQNADDARATNVVFILSEMGLTFAHDGQWFTLDNFRSLADGWSDKDPSQCIGHKGLGFRSVLDITPSPYLIKVDPHEFFAVKFSWALNYGHICETFRRDASCQQHYEKWTSQGQLACPIMAIPGEGRKSGMGRDSIIFDCLVRGDYGDKMTTMFWLPAVDLDIEKKALQDLGPTPIVSDQMGRDRMLRFLRNEVAVLMPFLKNVRDVRLLENGRTIGAVRLEGMTREDPAGQVDVATKIGGEEKIVSFFQMRVTLSIPINIKNEPETPKALRRMDKASLALSVRLESGQPIQDGGSCFHVYFSTKERTGTGFLVHGDFYVQPERTRLMDGAYNDWLLEAAARKAAGDFLTKLIGIYRPRNVFTALAPTDGSSAGAAAKFLRLFTKALRERRVPFLPTANGFLTPQEVVLSHKLDEDGFWDTNFSPFLKEVEPDKKSFLDYREDCEGTRRFAKLAGAEVLDPSRLPRLMEAASVRDRKADWWYRCYEYMTGDEKISRNDASFFAGYKIIPDTDSRLVAVSDGDGLIVCLPPTGDLSALRAPDCFRNIFVFVSDELRLLLEDGKDTVRSWVLNRLRITRFEATELLPRSIRGMVSRLFNGDLVLSPEELRYTWTFMKKIIDVSRAITSPTFWQEIGRFPIPIGRDGGDTAASRLYPAFLTYWPDSWLDRNSCLHNIVGLRRIDEDFLNKLTQESGIADREWVDLFTKCGVASVPRLLIYSRLVGKRQDVEFGATPPEPPDTFFTGDRQSDMNRAVIETARSERIWPSFVSDAGECGHGSTVVLQSLAILEGFRECVERAGTENRKDEEIWRDRLWSLVRGLPINQFKEVVHDTAHCFGGKTGGHSLEVKSYFRHQLELYGWLPSTSGPATISDCFFRYHDHRLISAGNTGEELGDILLPYVVAPGIDDVAKLQDLGIPALEGAASASPDTLLRALLILGKRLSTEWGREVVLKDHSRWRLVRGAIQEIYRRLNQVGGDVEWHDEIRLSCRAAVQGVEFQQGSIFYAEPGSAIEQAFKGVLHLIDADRPYPGFFELAGITRLTPGETVGETFVDKADFLPEQGLRECISEQLSPYLLAPIIARSEKGNQAELVLRRLRERFTLFSGDKPSVSFFLIQDPTIERTVDFQRFYLKSYQIERTGAIKEQHYALYLGTTPATSIFDLDGDALGEALIPIVVDRPSDELAPLFPRIVSRYQQAKGNTAEMEAFMLYQLHISMEALDVARALVEGDNGGLEPAAPPPPPPRIVISAREQTTAEGDEALAGAATKQEEVVAQKARNLISTITRGEPREGFGFAVSSGGHAAREAAAVTEEQRSRGLKGELECKRRLSLPGGLAGLMFKSDVRNLGCGYDFSCTLDGQDVKVEVKTFISEGRIIFTSRELQEAARDRENYYLVGLLDEGNSEQEWQVFIVPQPVLPLITKGEFEIEAKLTLQAAEIFELS
jgi:hypothetical protein